MMNMSGTTSGNSSTRAGGGVPSSVLGFRSFAGVKRPDVGLVLSSDYGLLQGDDKTTPDNPVFLNQSPRAARKKWNRETLFVCDDDMAMSYNELVALGLMELHDEILIVSKDSADEFVTECRPNKILTSNDLPARLRVVEKEGRAPRAMIRKYEVPQGISVPRRLQWKRCADMIEGMRIYGGISFRSSSGEAKGAIRRGVFVKLGAMLAIYSACMTKVGRENLFSPLPDLEELARIATEDCGEEQNDIDRRFARGARFELLSVPFESPYEEVVRFLHEMSSVLKVVSHCAAASGVALSVDMSDSNDEIEDYAGEFARITRADDMCAAWKNNNLDINALVV